MQKFEQKKAKVRGWIFFDFESSQDDEVREDKYGNKVYEHKVNLCVVQKVCRLCQDLELGECPVCGPNQVVFKGPETLDDFCQWLFDVANDACLHCHRAQRTVKFRVKNFSKFS
jgi:hypothetical protein